MSKNRLPEIKDPLKEIANLAINPAIKETPNISMEVKNIVEKVPEIAVTGDMVFGKRENPPGVVEDVMVNESLDLPLETKGQGKRGRDKKKRKKKVMTESQLAALAEGRKRSLEKRQAKAVSRKALKNSPKTPVPEMPKPTPHQKLDYSTFSNYMDMYEDSKKKKYSTSTQPHPNKVINERHRPTPPRSLPKPIPKAPQVMKWNGNISAYQTHKKSKNSRWNYGI
tara:strand:+ start:867 stop:1541 length:675 start_codon:yes stop_codon:yes gene_type:complete